MRIARKGWVVLVAAVTAAATTGLGSSPLAMRPEAACAPPSPVVTGILTCVVTAAVDQLAAPVPALPTTGPGCDDGPPPEPLSAWISAC